MHPAELSLREEKRALRRAMAEQRDALSADQRTGLAARAAELFWDLPEARLARTVAGFVSTRSEIDTAPLLDLLRQRGIDVVLPRVSTGLIPPRLRFHRADARSDLVFGIFGLLEPRSDAPEVAAHAIDLFMVPGLAFDRRGTRIGYGGGYYDELAAYVRAHPDATHARFVGYGFGFQLLDACPTGEWDVPLDAVVTDEGIVRCQEANG
ncbi:MAG: 5-formyltetrahydrofolate cyclo-ligase [Deltaproteobacteria bacterium]|jgi:5-formyltetrahydrofolate cyclo-ligase|nr:5-formyltetrahydrofolate cyclo-ligase [Deltaproteobacteria bacterium]